MLYGTSPSSGNDDRVLKEGIVLVYSSVVEQILVSPELRPIVAFADIISENNIVTTYIDQKSNFLQ